MQVMMITTLSIFRTDMSAAQRRFFLHHELQNTAPFFLHGGIHKTTSIIFSVVSNITIHSHQRPPLPHAAMTGGVIGIAC
jgi:hypothetical protein